MTTEPIPHQARRDGGAAAAPAQVEGGPARAVAGSDPLVMSVADAARALGVSDDLLYALTARGELPCVRFGRRRLIPRRAVELVLEAAVTGFDPSAVRWSLAGRAAQASERLVTGGSEMGDIAGAKASVDIASVPLYMDLPTSSTASRRSFVRRRTGPPPG